MLSFVTRESEGTCVERVYYDDPTKRIKTRNKSVKFVTNAEAGSQS